MRAGPPREVVLDIQASGATAIRPRHKGAKRVLVFPPVERDVPLRDRPQSQWHAGRGAERALVIAVKGRVRELVDQLLVARSHPSPVSKLVMRATSLLRPRYPCGRQRAEYNQSVHFGFGFVVS